MEGMDTLTTDLEEMAAQKHSDTEGGEGEPALVAGLKERGACPENRWRWRHGIERYGGESSS